LTPWRARDVPLSEFPRLQQDATLIAGPWESPQEKLTALELALRSAGAVVRRGSEFARWDLELQGGLLGGARVLFAVEDLCPGQQLVRFRAWPWLGRWGLGLSGTLVILGAIAGVDRSWIAAGVLAFAGFALLLRTIREAAYSQSTLLQLLRASEPPPSAQLMGVAAQADAEGA
jgi:hypothetical protein